MIEIIVAESWREVHPGARVGVLVLHAVQNPAQHAALDERKRQIEQSLRTQFAGKTKADLRELGTIHAYTEFYKKYGQTYHVLMQLESVALKGKPASSATALVQAMFMAEVNSQLLTAGHDLAAVVPPLTVAASRGGEQFVRINGKSQELKADDMLMWDAEGILSTVIYGPDLRTQIRPETRDVMYVTYAPKGVSEQTLRAYMEEIESYVRIVSPDCERDTFAVVG